MKQCYSVLNSSPNGSLETILFKSSGQRTVCSGDGCLSQLCRNFLGHTKCASDGEFTYLIDFQLNEDALNFNKMVFEINSNVIRPFSIFRASRD